ncbi:DUF2378 family protein [Stigmatella sp. ncwal1]|uniref:DUF2378 family protein n=1 Tax=Stigmatella ashevillensis TaxID=2995309 RepID=A0ABT5D854_9BACT|nr:DUF2378 family protein [Stigmatella ashevillena]MDC0709840.1 DUF2378 family protein [Stigmatella ashevillena]
MFSDSSEFTQRLALVQPTHMVRGLAFNAILALVAERLGDEASEALAKQVGLPRCVDFFSYPASDFLRLLYATAELLAPQLGTQEAVWQVCGAACLENFFYMSTVGRALSKIMGRNDPRRAFTYTPIAYSTVVNYGSREYKEMGLHRLRLVFKGDVQPTAFHEGTLQAALQVVGVQGTVTSTRLALDHTEFLLEWT